MHIFYDVNGTEVMIANATGKQKVIGKIADKPVKKNTGNKSNIDWNGRDDRVDVTVAKIKSDIEKERKKLREAYLKGKPRGEYAKKIMELTNILDTM